MERKEFINKITGGLAFTCVACMMEACSKEEATGGSGGGNNTGGTGSAILTINLNTQLMAVNDFISEKGVIVVRTATGNTTQSFVAFSNECPHAGATVTFVKASNIFNCPAHGSNFSITGSVTQGPANTGLSKKSIEISGTTLTVK